ncbi:CRISPR-associated endonuclease Cas2 [Candidatus Phycosocius spiralis]|uniref:CRISPR-associated endoribonuclease Cas2 n=1 Tax=Candidatus Phycosocius spiralis TaxID=2815099 RepID=A0ABQ4PW56_9PROT|nr:CRISPR-associated endonuclease Cas2 [Candidatus Phycosocius spiralis]GIU67210.1 CRISPR-associated endoribonuclease Cas2 [Candidatus Phycosocius spiralis]
MKALSAYRIMWVLTIFDLPVLTAAQRKKANAFRKYLLDLGFNMMQLSVYIQHAAGKEAAESLASKVGERVPRAGKVDVLFFTDKQYESIKVFRGVADVLPPKKPNQLELF